MKRGKRTQNGAIVIGRQVRRCREANALSQRNLAEMVMVSPSSITCLETGETMVSVYTIKKIAEVLDVPISFILECEKEQIDREALDGILERLNQCSAEQREGFIIEFERILDIALMKK